MNKPLIIGNIYRPPRELIEPLTCFIEEFNTAINHDKIRSKKMILSGDFNINLLKISEKIMYANFFDMLTANSLLPNIKCPTRITQTSATLIDNIFSNSLGDIVFSGIIANKSISDHQIIFSSFDSLTSLKLPMNAPTTSKFIDYDALKMEIKNSIYCKLNLNSDDDPNTNYNILESTLVTAIKKHTVIKQIKFNKFKHKKTPWITEGLLKSFKFRDKLHLKAKQPGLDDQEYATLKVNIKTYNKIIKRLTRKLKRKFMATKLDQCKSDLHVKQTWKLIYEVLGRNKKNTTSDAFIIDGENTHDPNIISARFNEFFINIGNSNTDTDTDQEQFKTYFRDQQFANLTFREITTEETIRIIHKLKNKHSCGHDEISTALLKTVQHELAPSITLVINESLKTGIFPDKLKIAKVIPVYKKGEDNVFNNYRPISLLPSISKIFETVIYKQLYEHIQVHNILTDSQYGFRKSHSTEYTAIELVDRIMRALDKKKIPFNIYIDLSKAFDMIDHQTIFTKLSYYGIQNLALNLLKNYLTNRKQYCDFKGTHSTLLPIRKGVPQGSILGPLLFSIYINDFINASNKFQFIMYADDTTLFSTYDTFQNHDDDSMDVIQTNINSELILILAWLKSNKLLINTSKTKMTVFHTSQRIVQYPSITINDTNVEIVDDFKFLGITLNKHLKWTTHTDMIANKISKYIGILNRLKHTFPPRILITLYNTLILPHFYYGLPLWGHHTSRLHKLQKRALRTITNSKFNAHSEPICKRLNILKLPDLYNLQLYKLYFKIKREVVPQYLTTSIPILTHSYNTRRTTDQQYRTHHAFADRNCLHAMIDLMNQSPEIKMHVATCTSLAHFISIVKQTILQSYRLLCNVAGCYVCSNN